MRSGVLYIGFSSLVDMRNEEVEKTTTFVFKLLELIIVFKDVELWIFGGIFGSILRSTCHGLYKLDTLYLAYVVSRCALLARPLALSRSFSSLDVLVYVCSPTLFEILICA